jgi:hypothetical protein
VSPTKNDLKNLEPANQLKQPLYVDFSCGKEEKSKLWLSIKVLAHPSLMPLIQAQRHGLFSRASMGPIPSRHLSPSIKIEA